MGLLNNVIPGVDIVGLSYKNTEHQGAFKDDGKSIFDVYCEDESGVRFLVEMQNWSQRYFNKRAVYYSTYAIQDQAAREKKHQLQTLEKDEWDYNYAPVYVVCFMNFHMRKKLPGMEKVREDEYLSMYRYREIETGEELGDGTTLVFVEMKKFRKRMEQCRTPREMLLCAMKNMSVQLDIPSAISDNPLLVKFYRTAELAALPQEIRLTYIGKFMSRNDMLNSIAEQLAEARAEERAEGRAEGHAEGRAEGHAEGRAEGHAEGREEAQRHNVVRLLRAGFSAETLAEILELSLEEVQKYGKQE